MVENCLVTGNVAMLTLCSQIYNVHSKFRNVCAFRRARH